MSLAAAAGPGSPRTSASMQSKAARRRRLDFMEKSLLSVGKRVGQDGVRLISRTSVRPIR